MDNEYYFKLTDEGGTPAPSESTQEYFVDFNPIDASPEKYIYCYVTFNGEEI